MKTNFDVKLLYHKSGGVSVSQLERRLNYSDHTEHTKQTHKYIEWLENKVIELSK